MIPESRKRSANSDVEIAWVTYHPRIVNQDIGKIHGCSFAFLYWSQSGGAICINSPSTIELISCENCFRTCVTTSYGGSIYFTSKLLSVSKCSWEVCYVHNGVDTIYGNVIYALINSFDCNLSASLACGPLREISGDSTFHIESSTISFNMINNTLCCSYGGSSGIETSGKTNNDAFAKYLNVANGTAYHVITIHPNQMNLGVYESNLVYCKIYFSYFAASKGVMTLRNCYIVTASTAKLTSGTINFINCTGNVQYNGITVSKDASIHLKRITAENCGYQNKDAENMYGNFLHVPSILLFIATVKNKLI